MGFVFPLKQEKKQMDYDAFYKTPLIRESYERKSTAELIEINRENTKRVLSLSDRETLVAGPPLIAEAKLCKEILERRRGSEKSAAQFLDNWEEELPARRDQAILHLPVGSSEIGQLIAEICSELGGWLDVLEIQSFCPDLAALTKEQMEELTNALTEEGILKRNEYGQVALRAILNEDLFYNFSSFGKDQDFILSPRKHNGHFASQFGPRFGAVLMIVLVLQRHGKPMSVQELCNYFEKDKSTADQFEIGIEWTGAKTFDLTAWMTKTLNLMKDEGYLRLYEVTPLPSGQLYYFPMLGEKEE